MAEHFEAKKHAYRQTQDGVVISFVCHPNDVAKMLTLAPLGTRYMVAVEEIGDDEKPVGKVRPQDLSGVTDLMRGETSKKDRRPFESLPLSQQAAMRCNDENFADFCDFRGWHEVSETVADWVRVECGVNSRSEIVAGTPAGDLWEQLEVAYQHHLTDRRYAQARRA